MTRLHRLAFGFVASCLLGALLTILLGLPLAIVGVTVHALTGHILDVREAQRRAIEVQVELGNIEGCRKSDRVLAMTAGTKNQ